MNKRLKNFLGIVIMVAAAACFLFSFTIQNQDLRNVGDISPDELGEVYYTAENVRILDCFAVRIETSRTDSDLDSGPEYSYHPEDDYPETGVSGDEETILRDTYYLIELDMLDGKHTAVMSVEGEDGPAFAAGETISLCGWVSKLSVTDKAEYTELKEAAKAENPDAAPEAEFTLYYRGASLEAVADEKAAVHKTERTVFIILGVVLMLGGSFLREKKYKDDEEDDMRRFR